MTEIEAKQEMTRAEVADYLRDFAAQLDTSEGSPDARVQRERDDDHRVTFMVGNDSATINPPKTITFEVEVESEGSLIGEGAEQEVEFELAWQIEESPEGAAGEELEIK